MTKNENAPMRRDETATRSNSDAPLTQPGSPDVLALALSRARPSLPPTARDIARTLIEALGNLKTYKRQDWQADERMTLPGKIKVLTEQFSRNLGRM
jgi:hypothetical protein